MRIIGQFGLIGLWISTLGAVLLAEARPPSPSGAAFGCISDDDSPRQAAPIRNEERLPPELAADSKKAVDRALAYLAGTQNADGGWVPRYGPAVTALAAQAFAQDRQRGPNDPVVKRALAQILKFEQTDGGIYERTQNLANYQTSIVLSFLSHVEDPAVKPQVSRAQGFLTKLQFDAEEDIDEHHNWYGGAGYNSSKRPDLSNTQMMLEALHDSGLPQDSATYQKALKFIARCQLLDSVNDQPFAKGRTDGGFIYSPNGSGESKAGPGFLEAIGPLRSYGTMTYAGFKSMLYAGVGHDDPRVKAAYAWIQKHYTLDRNPGMPTQSARQGLYYYYHVFSRALQAWGEPRIKDAAGRTHDWRVDLCRKLIESQKPDGSWVNDDERWLEGDPSYVTAITVLSIQAAME